MKISGVPRRFQTSQKIMLSGKNGTCENFEGTEDVLDTRKNHVIREKRKYGNFKDTEEVLDMRKSHDVRKKKRKQDI